MQRSLLASHLAHPDHPAQSMPLLSHLDGPIDTDRLARAFAEVVATNDVLRTRLGGPGAASVDALDLADAADLPATEVVAIDRGEVETAGPRPGPRSRSTCLDAAGTRRSPPTPTAPPPGTSTSTTSSPTPPRRPSSSPGPPRSTTASKPRRPARTTTGPAGSARRSRPATVRPDGPAPTGGTDRPRPASAGSTGPPSARPRSPTASPSTSGRSSIEPGTASVATIGC